MCRRLPVMCDSRGYGYDGDGGNNDDNDMRRDRRTSSMIMIIVVTAMTSTTAAINILYCKVIVSTFSINNEYVSLFQHAYHRWPSSTVRIIQDRCPTV